MAKFYRKNKISQSFPVTLNGEVFHISLRKMNTIEMMNLASVGSKITRNIALRDNKTLLPEEIQDLVLCIIDITDEVHGLLDDDDKEIKWADLDKDARMDLLLQADFDTVSALFRDASTVGALSDQEKKA